MICVYILYIFTSARSTWKIHLHACNRAKKLLYKCLLTRKISRFSNIVVYLLCHSSRMLLKSSGSCDFCLDFVNCMSGKRCEAKISFHISVAYAHLDLYFLFPSILAIIQTRKIRYYLFCIERSLFQLNVMHNALNISIHIKCSPFNVRLVRETLTESETRYIAIKSKWD